MTSGRACPCRQRRAALVKAQTSHEIPMVQKQTNLKTAIGFEPSVYQASNSQRKRADAGTGTMIAMPVPPPNHFNRMF